MQHDRTGAGRRAHALVIRASHWEAERLESRVLLSAVMSPPDVVEYHDPNASPLPPNPGHTFYVAGLDSTGAKLSQMADNSAITPYTTNDLVMNVSPSATNYVACCEGSGGTLGANLLTNGLTQSQTAPAPNPGVAAVGDGGASDLPNDTNTISTQTRSVTSFVYTLGSAGGATPSAHGYDLSEIDVITGQEELRTGIFGVDILVEPVGGDQFLSISGGAGYQIIRVPTATGGMQKIDTGSFQMAIVSNMPGQPITQHVQAVEFEILDASSFYRELVVTGTPSSAALSSAPAAPTGAAVSLAAGYPTVSWNASTGAVGYSVLRSTSESGSFAPVGSVVDQTTFADTTAQPNTTYFYEVVAAGAGDSSSSAPTAPATTSQFGAKAYVYQNQLWTGTPTISEIVPYINYAGDNYSAIFPLQVDFDSNAFSVFVEGKITTDRAGTYTFTAPTDDDGYLWVNGQLVSENPGEAIGTDVNTPITLAANTSYSFVYLADNWLRQWEMYLKWQEPNADGSAGASTLIPTTHLVSDVDEPPVPQTLTVSALANNAIQVNWSNAGDTSSYAYVVERATADSSGNPTSAFTTIGQSFSGPTVRAANGAATWGATSFVDTTASADTAYVYRVGPILPDETTPPALSNTSLAVTASSTGGSSNLSASISGKLPATLIAGQKATVDQVVTIVDSSSSAVTGNVRADLFLSTGMGVDADSIHLGVANQRVKLKSRGHATVKIKLPTLSASIAPGSYHLVVQITDPKGGALGVTSSGFINIIAPKVDLSGTFSKAVTPAKSGKTPLTFTVKNSGNVAAIGLLTFAVDTSTDGSLANASTFTTLKQKVNLKAGKSTKVSGNVKLPPGTYFVLIQIDPNNAFKDVDLTNNLIVSNSTVTVV